MPMSVTAYRGDEQRGRKGDRQEPSFLETIIELGSRLTRGLRCSRSSATQERVQCLYEGQKLCREVITTT
jgi:hypothetical protein